MGERAAACGADRLTRGPREVDERGGVADVDAATFGHVREQRHPGREERSERQAGEDDEHREQDRPMRPGKERRHDGGRREPGDAAVTGITLGLVRQKGFNRQNGRNQAFNHAGNMVGAGLSGLLGWLYGFSAVFWLAARSA